MRITVEKRPPFVCILVSFLVYGLICYELLPAITESIQGKLFSSTLSEGIPPHDSENYPVPLSLWHVNQSDIAFAEGITVVISNRVSTGRTSTVWNALCSHPQNMGAEHISLYPVDCPDTGFKLAKVQACQYFDIPPPPVSALL